jgi:hypothetical protein
MTRRPDGWSFGQLGVWTGRHIIRTADRESFFLSVQNLLKILMNSRISVKKHLYIYVILSNRMWPITN